MRDYTKVHPSISANNHPVQHGAVVGIHNGHIDNDDALMARHRFERAHPQMTVDSEIIFAVAEATGSQAAPFEEFRGSPQYLYHYTSVRGVEGILKTKSVWASVLHFLNDSKEWKHGFELAQTRIVRRLGERKGDAQWDYLLEDLIAWLEHHTWDVCVFSLSAMPNQMS